MGVAWQNCAYNQPPHLGYYLPDFVDGFQGVKDDVTPVRDVLAADKEVLARTYYNINGQRITSPTDGQRFYIVKTHYSDGSVSTQKCMAK
jgi:hypothetical protein